MDRGDAFKLIGSGSSEIRSVKSWRKFAAPKGGDRQWVDGRSAKIEQAYGAVRGVVVEAGDHVIDMRYRPWSVFVGAAMSLAAAVIVVIGLLRHEHN